MITKIAKKRPVDRASPARAQNAGSRRGWGGAGPPCCPRGVVTEAWRRLQRRAAEGLINASPESPKINCRERGWGTSCTRGGALRNEPEGNMNSERHHLMLFWARFQQFRKRAIPRPIIPEASSNQELTKCMCVTVCEATSDS